MYVCVTLQLSEYITPQHSGCVTLPLLECDTATLRIRDTATLRICDTATLRILDTATLRMCDTATITIRGTATLRIRDTATLRIRDTATLTIRDTATLRIRDTATLRIYDTAILEYMILRLLEYVRQGLTRCVCVCVLQQLLIELIIIPDATATLVVISHCRRAAGSGFGAARRGAWCVCGGGDFGPPAVLGVEGPLTHAPASSLLQLLCVVLAHARAHHRPQVAIAEGVSTQ